MTDIARHYAAGPVLDAILAGLRAAGKGPEHITPGDLAPVDQFHSRAIDGTRSLMHLAKLEPGQRVLDLGGGIGGAARVLAGELGCRVTVLDLTEAYVRAGTELTRRAGLADRVDFVHGDALATDLPAGAFDVVWTQHSSMNIADKPGLYREAHRVLRAGGRLAVHEIMAGATSPIRVPTPWAREARLSFLVPPAEHRRIVANAGFAEREWHDTTEATRAWIRNRIAAAKTPASPSPLGVHLLLGADTPTMFANFQRNVEEGRVAVVEAVFERR